MRREAGEAARARDRQAAAASQDEAEESDATGEEATRERTTRVGRPRGGMKVGLYTLFSPYSFRILVQNRVYILEYGKNMAPNRAYILEYSLNSG